MPGFEFTLKDASAIAIIGGADGPTAIFLASKLAPDLLGAIAVAAYSYMALVPIIQPPIMRALTSEQERKIEMPQLRAVSKKEKIIFFITKLKLLKFNATFTSHYLRIYNPSHLKNRYRLYLPDSGPRLLNPHF